MPGIIIVALPAGDFRQQDYTPNELPQHSNDQLGQADRFVKFLTRELMPYIEQNYRTAPFRILSGHSRNDLFALNHMIDRAPIFQAYLSFSPALWPKDFAVIDKVGKRLQQHTLKNVFLYANVGGREAAKMIKSLNGLRSQLTKFAPEGLRWSIEIATDESHGTTPIVGHLLGLRKLFVEWDRPWKQTSSCGFAAIKPEYELLSEQFGYRVVPQERSLDEVGYDYLDEGDTKMALEAFKLNVEYYPNSANVYEGLAEAQEADGSLQDAMETMEKGVSLLDQRNYSNRQEIPDHHARLKTKLIR